MYGSSIYPQMYLRRIDRGDSVPRREFEGRALIINASQIHPEEMLLRAMYAARLDFFAHRCYNVHIGGLPNFVEGRYFHV